MTEEKAPEKVSKKLSKEDRLQRYANLNASMLDFAKWLAEVRPEKRRCVLVSKKVWRHFATMLKA